MVHKCCISSCGMSVRVIGARGLSYHTFPTKEPNRDKWIQAVLPHVEKPELFRIVQGYTRICSRHFKKKDYSLDSKKRARLNSSAVPSLFPGRDARDSSVPSKTESRGTTESTMSRSDASTENLTISPKRKKTPPLTLAKDAVEYKIFGDFRIPHSEPLPLAFDPGASSNEIQSQAFSEDDTASSTFSSQEETYISSFPSQHSKPSGKIRKRRKNRASLPLSSNSSKKRSSASEDLNIEGVGDALAEINLSAFISASSDLKQESKIRKNSSPSSASEAIPPPSKMVNNALQNALEPTSHADEEILASLGSFSIQKESVGNSEFEQDLLQSIQAVSISPAHANETPTTLLIPVVTPISEADSANPSQAATVANYNGEGETLSGRLEDIIYADLVDGGASLSLEDSSHTIFDSQVLIDALQSATNDLQSAGNIDQLTRDLNESLLGLDVGALSSSMLNMDDFHISDFVSFSNSNIIPEAGNQSTAQNTLIKPEIVESQSFTASRIDPIVFVKQNELDVPKKRNKEETADTDSFPESEEITPAKSRKKSARKEKSTGTFSVERFSEDPKDIEYYTGFSSHEKFYAFFRSIDSHVENLKVTDMMHGVASMGLSTGGVLESTTGDREPLNDDGPSQDEPKRRLSLGRSLSRVDELFMTIIRLKRKIPEKILGHMFCISQPSVSRIVRAWTMLLSKVLELVPVDKQSSLSSCSTSEKSSPEDPVPASAKTEVEIPNSFRQLFHSDLAQNIISSGNAATASRKTSSSTSCPNSSRSKRPKKEKIIVVVSEDLLASSAPPPTTEEIGITIRSTNARNLDYFQSQITAPTEQASVEKEKDATVLKGIEILRTSQ